MSKRALFLVKVTLPTCISTCQLQLNPPSFSTSSKLTHHQANLKTCKLPKFKTQQHNNTASILHSTLQVGKHYGGKPGSLGFFCQYKRLRVNSPPLPSYFAIQERTIANLNCQSRTAADDLGFNLQQDEYLMAGNTM